MSALFFFFFYIFFLIILRDIHCSKSAALLGEFVLFCTGLNHLEFLLSVGNVSEWGLSSELILHIEVCSDLLDVAEFLSVSWFSCFMDLGRSIWKTFKMTLRLMLKILEINNQTTKKWSIFSKWIKTDTSASSF